MSAQKPFDILIYIGCFQPFHNGHKYVVDQALAACDTLLILVGSAQKPRSIKDPWTVDERFAMIRHALSEQDSSRVVLGSLLDTLYNDEQWVRSVHEEVQRAMLLQPSQTVDALKIGLIAHEKGHGYLPMFPEWQHLDVSNWSGLSAMAIREALFENTVSSMIGIESSVPPPVCEFLKSFTHTFEYSQLSQEFAYIRSYKKSWEYAPYAPIFVTSDAIVVYSGHVLLIRRRAAPGKGLWAWPGGFVDQTETVREACIRELHEETCLNIPTPELLASIKAQHVFDRPDRSRRGRTITHAFLFEFPVGELPAINASDDADQACWVPLAQFFTMHDQMFEDHFDIGFYFLRS